MTERAANAGKGADLPPTTPNLGETTVQSLPASPSSACRRYPPAMKILLAALITLVTLVWAWGVAFGKPLHGAPPWVIRQHGLHLSGLLTIALLSLAVLLSCRPAWLTATLGGMADVYRTHKWAGILSGVFAGLHWLIELSSDLLKATIGRQGRVPKEPLGDLLEAMQHLARDVGEWSFYGLLALLAIALWTRLPYRLRRPPHRAMPLLYLLLAFHTLLLAPSAYWSQPAGWLLAALLAAGGYGSIISLAGMRRPPGPSQGIRPTPASATKRRSEPLPGREHGDLGRGHEKPALGSPSSRWLGGQSCNERTLPAGRAGGASALAPMFRVDSHDLTPRDALTSILSMRSVFSGGEWRRDRWRHPEDGQPNTSHLPLHFDDAKLAPSRSTLRSPHQGSKNKDLGL